MWNPESTDMESGIHSMEFGIQDSLGLPYMGRLKSDFGTDSGILLSKSHIIRETLLNKWTPCCVCESYAD